MAYRLGMPTLFPVLLVYLLPDSAGQEIIVPEDQVYCPTETFSPTCSRDEIVIIDFAYYGRMRMSRCVKVDFGYIGCYDDVTREADLRCSGKHECEIRIPDAAFNDAESCMGDLVRYFEGSHHCQPVVHASRTQCQSSFSIRAPTPSGMLASIVTQETGCGARNRPWVIEVETLQRINLTLYDFSVLNPQINSMLPCPEYVTVKEVDSRETTRICGGKERIKHVYTSKTNKIEIEMSLAQIQPAASFAIHYEAIGCIQPELPPGTQVRSYSDHVIVSCGSSTITWRLECRGNTWFGSIGNCSSPALARSTGLGDAFTGLVSAIPNGYAIAIIIAIAIVISATILVFGLVYMKRRHNSFRGSPSSQRTSVTNDKDIYYAKCNMEMDGTLRHSLRHQRGGSRHNSVTTTAHGAHDGLTKNGYHMNAYDYEHGSNWTPARNNIPSYTTGSDREPPVEHIYESPVFARRSEPGTNDTAYFELDPDEVQPTPQNNYNGVTTPQDSMRQYWH